MQCHSRDPQPCPRCLVLSFFPPTHFPIRDLALLGSCFLLDLAAGQGIFPVNLWSAAERLFYLMRRPRDRPSCVCLIDAAAGWQQNQNQKPEQAVTSRFGEDICL